MKKEVFVIFDGNALLHRAFHALPPLATKKGELVNAVYGFISVLLKVLKDIKPKYAAVAFDRKEPTFRHDLYPEYKAQRIKAPQELYDQLPRIKEVVEAFNLPLLELKGYEADDIIGTLAKKFHQNNNIETLIVTGDMDTLQLVDDHIKVLTLKRGIGDEIIYDQMEVKKRYGLNPEQMIDFKALRGDPSDNIPGVHGIGEKTASQLLEKYHTLEGVYETLKKGKLKAGQRVAELLKEHKEDALLSKKLARIDLKAPVKFALNDGVVGDYDLQKVYELFSELEFKSLLQKLPTTQKGKTQELFYKDREHKDYHLIDDEKSLNKFLDILQQQDSFVIDLETTSLNPRNSEILGLSFSFKVSEAYYVNLKDHAEWLAKLNPFIRGGQKKIGHNLKFDYEVLDSKGICLNNIDFDTMIASYVLNSISRNHDLDTIVFGEFGHKMISIGELLDKKKGDLRDADTRSLSIYSCEDADYTFRLKEKFEKELEQQNIEGLFRKIEMPLVEVLARIEQNGVLLDLKLLKKISGKIDKEIKKIEAKIHKLAGAEFNISSPQQLREVLFEKLKLSHEGLAKIKTGISTSAMELEKLKPLHPVVSLIFDYRELKKLKNTYVDALPGMVDTNTGRVHTSYNQTVTQTGRLSSSDPNLQNIPVRTEVGKEIRKAFIAEKGNKLVSADYSQIELRVVASLSGDKEMIKIFNEGQDIHKATAAFIHDVPISKVTDAQRYAAKEVNFGVLYGMGVYGLSMRTGIDRDKAKQFIDRYFGVFEGLSKYLEETISIARAMGYSETLFGRKRYLPEINSGVSQVRAQAERMAVNMPVQGTAADLMKLAMIAVDKGLSKVSPDAKMLMQVHDELVFSVPESDVKRVAKFLEEEMENVYKLKVPIETRVKMADNWGEMEEII